MSPLDESIEINVPPSPAASLPWGWGSIFKAGLLIVFGIIGLGILAAVTMGVLGLDPQTMGGMSSPLLFGLGLGIYLLVILAVYLFAVRKPHSSWQLVGVRRFAAGWWPALLLIFPLQMAAMTAVNLAISWLLLQITGDEFENPQIEAITGGMSLDTGDLVLLLLLIAVVAPIAEELFFRGMLYPVLRVRLGATMAISLNALLFAAVHFIPPLLPGLFVIGLVLTWVRERSDSVIPGILLHMAQNGLVVLALYAYMETVAS
jgi:uncharacterized protein